MMQSLTRFAVRYLIVAALLTALTFVGVSLFKISRVWRVVRESQKLVESERASQAVGLLLRFEPWAAPYPAVARQLLKGLVQAYAGAERTEDARRAAERMLSDAGADDVPAGLGAAWSRRAAPLVETIVRAVWNPPAVSRWDGYEWLLHDLNRQRRDAEIEILVAQLLARNPDADRRQRILAYRPTARPPTPPRRRPATDPAPPPPPIEPTVNPTQPPAPVAAPVVPDAPPPATPPAPPADDTRRQALLARRAALAAELKTLPPRDATPARQNPHRVEYQRVAADYKAAETKAAAVERKFESATGPDRMQYADQLRLMKNQYTDLMSRYRRVKAQYDQWEREHPAAGPDSRADALAAELAAVDAELDALGAN